MSAEIPPNKSENKEIIDDNARKFIVTNSERDFLKENNAISYDLITDWLELNEDTEKKLAYKKFDNGEVQILLISKVSKDGNRTSTKEKIDEEQYNALLESSILHIEKRRHEFEYVQNDITFSIKFDEFSQSDLLILEADAETEKDRNSFDAVNFSVGLTEVTGDVRYYGYRVADVI
jgi:CYTH domain-containing protein